MYDSHVALILYDADGQYIRDVNFQGVPELPIVGEICEVVLQDRAEDGVKSPVGFFIGEVIKRKFNFDLYGGCTADTRKLRATYYIHIRRLRR